MLSEPFQLLVEQESRLGDNPHGHIGELPIISLLAPGQASVALLKGVHFAYKTFPFSTMFRKNGRALKRANSWGV